MLLALWEPAFWATSLGPGKVGAQASVWFIHSFVGDSALNTAEKAPASRSLHSTRKEETQVCAAALWLWRTGLNRLKLLTFTKAHCDVAFSRGALPPWSFQDAVRSLPSCTTRSLAPGLGLLSPGIPALLGVREPRSEPHTPSWPCLQHVRGGGASRWSPLQPLNAPCHCPAQGGTWAQTLPMLCEEMVNGWQHQPLSVPLGRAGFFVWHFTDSVTLFHHPWFSLQPQQVDRTDLL